MKPIKVISEGPGIFRKAGNLGKAIKRHVENGMKQVTQEQYEERLSVCSECEFHKDMRCQHVSCGCFLSKKAWWDSEKCPLKTEEFPEGKWPALEIIEKPED